VILNVIVFVPAFTLNVKPSVSPLNAPVGTAEPIRDLSHVFRHGLVHGHPSDPCRLLYTLYARHVAALYLRSSVVILL
jgi:hypothetical protein